ncbi:MAG: bacterial Ig-like domain-containing protein [Acholeplasmataceae bacterium]|jgi:hypothetical protein|nr:hypothetical protein [Erysipelotrichia bacterium]
MKLKTKIWTSLLTGSFLTLALLFSSVNLTKSKAVNEVSAAAGDTAATFTSGNVISGTPYTTYENDDWTITLGGNNSSIGSNDKENNYKNLVLGSRVNVMGFDGNVLSTDKYYSAVISNKTISNVGKISLSIGGTAKNSNTISKIFLTSCDSPNGSFALVKEINSLPTSATEYTFTTLMGEKYYALIFYAPSGWFRLDNVVANFYEGENPRTLDSLSVSGTPTKTSYFIGDSFDPTGLTVKANYDDESDKDVTDKCVFTPSPLTLGTTDILVSYTEEEIEETYLLENIISVTERHLESLQITTNPAKMNYFVGDSFDPTGMVIKAKYDLGPDIKDYKGYDYSPKSAFASAGSKTITITDLVDNSISTTLSVLVSELPPITELFFSEYIEGSSNNKALEIYNGTGSDVNLSDYSIKLFANGVSTTSTVLVLSGSINNDSTYTIVNTQASNTLKNKANITEQQVTGFNGDDAIGLYKGSVLIDVIGIIGNDPGTQWTGDAANGPGSTLDKTLVRTSTTFGPNTSFTWSEWNCYPADTFTYFGSHMVELGAPSVNEEAIAYAEMFLDDTADSCAAQSLSGLEAIWGDFKEVYEDVLSDEAKDYFANLTPDEEGNAAEHALARYLFIITKYKTLDNFMVDSQGVLIFNVNLADHVSTVDYPKIIAIITVLLSLTLVSGTYLIVRRKHKYN